MMGGAVAPVRRTGELRIVLPNGSRFTVNCRRKDAPMKLRAAIQAIGRPNADNGHGGDLGTNQAAKQP
jgi:hypothetical protein